MAARSFLHVINLRRVGGVGRLFIEYLASAEARGHVHHLLLLERRVHPLYGPVCREFIRSRCSFHEWACAVRVPRGLRRGRRKKIYRDCPADTVVFWNDFDPEPDLLDALPQGTYKAFYDHELTWTHDRTALAPFLERMDAFIACGDASAAMLRLRWQVTRPITLVRNGSRLTDQPLPPPHERNASAPLRIGFLGRFVPSKGVALLPAILAAVREQGQDATLLLAGEGPDDALIRTEADRLGIAEHVHRKGLVADIVPFLGEIDVLVSTSVRDPFPLVILEALSQGVPVVAPHIDSFGAMIEDGVCGRVIPPTLPLSAYPAGDRPAPVLPDVCYDPLADALMTPRLVDPVAMAQAILDVAADPARYHSMSVAAIAQVEKAFRFDRWLREIDAALTERG